MPPGPAPFPIESVPKPPLSLARVLPRALRHRRSAIHERFAPPAFVAAVRRAAGDRLVARRLYMAEAALEAGEAPDAIAEVLESDVLRRREGALAPILALEARRTAADERRCLQAARSVIALSADEARGAEGVLGRRVPRLDLVFPPVGERPQPVAPGPTALYLGDRAWAPNLAGLRELYRLWPVIRARVPAAELLVAGGAVGAEPAPPPGVRVLGFVEDLDEVWAAARVLLAPIPIGGGVRVKVLEAAARGLPVVGSPAAIGSIGAYLPIEGLAGDDAIVERAAELLGDGAGAEVAGRELWEANARHVAEGRMEQDVTRWLTGAGS